MNAAVYRFNQLLALDLISCSFGNSEIQKLQSCLN